MFVLFRVMASTTTLTMMHLRIKLNTSWMPLLNREEGNRRQREQIRWEQKRDGRV